MKLKNYKHQITHFQAFRLFYQKIFLNSRHELDRTKTLLNHILMIIFEFHAQNKKILFVGFPKQFHETLKGTKHLQIPELISNGIWENRKSKAEKAKQSKNIAKLTQKLKKKADLIVIYSSAKDKLLSRKSYLNGIPLIIVSKQLQIFNNGPQDYNFPIQKSANLGIFFSLLKKNLPNIEILKEEKKDLLFKNLHTTNE